MGSTVLMGVGVAAIGALIGRLVIKGDNKVENRRRTAIAVSGELRKEGYEKIPSLLEDYAIGDYSSMATKMYKLYVLVEDGDGLKAELEAAFDKRLKAKLQNPDEKLELMKVVNGT